MTIGADKGSDRPERENKGDGVCADDTRRSLVCLATFIPSQVLFFQYVYGQLSLLGQRVHDLERQLEGLSTTIEKQYRQYDEHMATLAACQRDTAKALNHELERYALHPAIEAVAALAEELFHLQDSARQLLDSGVGDDGAGPLTQEIGISGSVARERLANLDIRTIAPSAREQLDSKEHAVCAYNNTEDEDLHGQIGKLVTPGVVYRGKVLRQARVVVFRCETSGDQE